MKKAISAILAAMLLMLSLNSRDAAAADADLIEKAKKEGALQFYTTRAVAAMNALTKGFEAKYGIKVEGSRHVNEDLISKVVNETKAGRPSADVFDGSSGVTSLMEAGLVAPYKPKEAENFDPAYKDPDGHWTAVNIYVAGLAYNTDLVKGADIPNDLPPLKWSSLKYGFDHGG